MSPASPVTTTRTVASRQLDFSPCARRAARRSGLRWCGEAGGAEPRIRPRISRRARAAGVTSRRRLRAMKPGRSKRVWRFSSLDDRLERGWRQWPERHDRIESTPEQLGPENFRITRRSDRVPHRDPTRSPSAADLPRRGWSSSRSAPCGNRRAGQKVSVRRPSPITPSNRSMRHRRFFRSRRTARPRDGWRRIRIREVAVPAGEGVMKRAIAAAVVDLCSCRCATSRSCAVTNR